jgi:copper chaperone CopZ
LNSKHLIFSQSKVDGVISVDVSFARQQAVVRGSATPGELIAAVEDVGFEAKLLDPDSSLRDIEAEVVGSPSSGSPDLILAIQGMKDPKRCPRKVADVITAVDGVLDVLVDFETAVAQVWGFAELDPVQEGNTFSILAVVLTLFS